jgi:hypothetical protein
MVFRDSNSIQFRLNKMSITNKIKNLPNIKTQHLDLKSDWLISNNNFIANVYGDEIINEIILSNGLISRTFKITPNGATIGYDNLMTGESLLRGVKAEGRITLNDYEYNIGGLTGQVEYGYILPEWKKDWKNVDSSFQLVDFTIEKIKARMEWKRIRHCEDREWPPKGVELVMVYKAPETAPAEIHNIKIKIHYECYDGIPLFSKWITVENHGEKEIVLNTYVNEILALVEALSVVNSQSDSDTAKIAYPHIYFESDYSFRGMVADGANFTTHWKSDQQYSSQVAYLSNSKNLMESYLDIGPGVKILPKSDKNDNGKDKSIFEGYRDFQLVLSSYDRQRRGLAKCQMYRTIAPWITENPIMMHLTSFDPEVLKVALEQMEETGFEMLIFSFGSMFDSSVLELGAIHPDWVDDMIEEIEEEYTGLVRAKNFDVGGYSLLASRKISVEDDVVNPYTGKTSDVNSPQMEDGIQAIQGVDEDTANIPGVPTFGNSPCLNSDWGKRYFDSLYNTIEKLNLTLLEHDGSYPGDVCASTKHPGHEGLHDSQWAQWKTITDFYKWCRSRGVYLNVPDWYMLAGSNKTGIGYKEVNWSLPRDRQVMLGRQNIYDGTWAKTPSMGWTFCPLTKYHTVPEYPPEVATLEPLSEHLSHYESHLAQNFGCGVQACYRGIRLYDTEETKKLVEKYVTWYKKYRDILDSDIVHIKRPDGRHIDCILHVNPKLKVKGLAMFFNPTAETLKEHIKIPLYYTGLTDKVKISEKEEVVNELTLDRNYNIYLDIKIPAKSHTWFKFE